MPKRKCQLWQNGTQFFLFHIYKTGWVNIVLGILNQEGQQNCMIGSKVTTMLPPIF